MAGCAEHDLSLPLGFMLALLSALGLMPGGLCHLAPVCSSFCWINSYTHRRTAVTPLGCSERDYVNLGNILCERSVCVALIVYYRGGLFLLEQPRNSKMQLHPAVQFMLDHLMSHGRPILRNTVHLGQYGADSDKPVWLYCLEELQLPEYAPENSSSSSSLPVTVETLGLCNLCTSMPFAGSPMM